MSQYVRVKEGEGHHLNDLKKRRLSSKRANRLT